MGALQRIMGAAGRIVGRPSAPPVRARYMRDTGAPVFGSWRPALRDASEDVRAAWIDATARSIDALHNSGWMAGAVDQAIAAMVGTGLKLNAKPDGDAIGWDEATSAAWARMVERRHEAWASNPYECDLRGKWTIAQQTSAAVRTWFAGGEIVATLPYVLRPGSTVGTKLAVQPVGRLSQRTEGPDLFQGVRLNRDGLPTGYVFSEKRPGGWAQERELVARDRFGRPAVVHIFDGMPGQVRGITPLAPALRVVRQFDQLADATLTAALIQAIFAATIESDLPSDQVLEGLATAAEQDGKEGAGLDALIEARTDFYSGSKIDLGIPGKFAHLFSGDKLKFNHSEHPNSTYEAFAKFLLREVFRCIGVTYEQGTGDYSGATFSSIRMSGAEAHALNLHRRKNIAAPLPQAAYECWLEEEVGLGRIPFPGGLDAFVALRTAVCRADWRGPPRPIADDLKTANAQKILMGLGVMTKERACAEYGEDWEDVDEQLAREAANRARLGLGDPVVGGTQPLEPQPQDTPEPAA